MGRVAAIVVVLLALAGAGAWWWWSEWRAPPPLPPPAAPAAPAAVAPSGPRNPMPPAPVDAPLPPLGESDAAVTAALAQALPPTALERLLLEGFVRRVVATVDNLPREQYAQRLSPLRTTPGSPRVSRSGDAFTWDVAANEARYAPIVAAFDAADPARIVAFYQRHYPLFQAAYEELGYPGAYFNDRLVEVIDHLLGTPDVKGPIRLVQPKVLYEFADPELQSLSAGRKVLVRLGPANAARVKAKLRAFRERIAAGPAGARGGS